MPGYGTRRHQEHRAGWTALIHAYSRAGRTCARLCADRCAPRPENADDAVLKTLDVAAGELPDRSHQGRSGTAKELETRLADRPRPLKAARRIPDIL